MTIRSGAQGELRKQGNACARGTKESLRGMVEFLPMALSMVPRLTKDRVPQVTCHRLSIPRGMSPALRRYPEQETRGVQEASSHSEDYSSIIQLFPFPPLFSD